MHKYHNFSKRSNYDFFLSQSTCLSYFHYDSKVKHYLIFSDETGKKLSPLTSEIIFQRRWDSEKCAESVNVAAWIWQNCLFSHSAISSSFFSPSCLWKSLHIHDPRVLRTCHRACYIALAVFLCRMASEAKTLHQTNSVQLTQSGSKTDSQWSLA